MSTLSEREAMLRRALHAAADGIEPAGDGLQRIQGRLRPPRPLALAWAEAVWTDIFLRVPAAPAGFRSAFEQVVSVMRLAWGRFGPTSRTGTGRAARTLSWLRPLAALGVTVSIVAAGAYVALDAQQAIFPSSANSQHPPGGNTGRGGGSAGGSGNANAQSQSPVGGQIYPSGGSSTSRNCASVAPAVSPSPGIGTINPTSPAPSTSSSDSTSPSSSTSNVSTPNPTATATNAPVGGPTTGASTPAAGSNSVAVTQSPKPKKSLPPCAGQTTTRNPVVKAYPNTQVSTAPPQATPSAAIVSPPGGQDSPAALGFVRLEEIG